MRIISGQFKGFRFNPPAKNWPTRPTTDISKEGLYNILQNSIDFEEITFLDLFGGTGNHCYEVISRGCQEATYVDKFGGCVAFVKTISQKLEIEDKIKIFKMDVFKFIKTCNRSFDYIFAGPPYPLKNIPDIPDLIFEHGLLNEGGLFVLEHNPNVDVSSHPKFDNQRNYGQTIFSFFRH